MQSLSLQGCGDVKADQLDQVVIPKNWSNYWKQLTRNAVCLFSRKRRSKGHEQELREELLQSTRIGIENYPSQKAFATPDLSDSHSSTISDKTNGFSRKYATLSHARFKEKGRDKTQKTTQERIFVECFFYQLGSDNVWQPTVLHDTVHPVTRKFMTKFKEK